MDVKLVSADSDPRSHALLERLYAAGYVAAEKKPFLVDLQRCSGPFLAIDGVDEFLLDGASQIATLGLGFNHASMFGAAEHLESWIDWSDSPGVDAVRRSFADLLRRKLCESVGETVAPSSSTDAKDHFATFCHSGAQAIELAFAAAYAARRHPAARRILAFEGAFHGRTKIALETTHGPDKRLPFSWTEHAAHFVSYPELAGDEIEAAYDRPAWKQTWTARNDDEYAAALGHLREALPDDPVAAAGVEAEIHSLQEVRRRVAAGEVFCILIEPLQSEGGERYSSGRFHQGLAWLAQTFSVPLIYDEIQCGAHLGRTFFWHRQFALVDRNDRPWIPDGVVCAKKAQVGIVLSRCPLEYRSPVPVASLVRGYIQCSLLDQSSAEIAAIEGEVRARLRTLAERWPQWVSRTRCRGLAFAFDLPDAATAKQFVEQRFRHGLIFYPAGKRTARFRLALSFTVRELDLLFHQIDAALGALNASSANTVTGVTTPNPISAAPAFRQPVTLRDPRPLADFHREWIAAKMGRLPGDHAGQTTNDVLQFIHRELTRLQPELDGAEICLLDPASYPAVRDQILQLQVEVYEPARQTPGSDFDAVFASNHPMGIVLLHRERLVGMAIAGSIDHFQHVQGIPEDPLAANPDTVYMVDVTVVAEFRGGLGRVLKQALTLLATQRGVRWMVGRNRDRRARGMWAINLALGAVQTRHLVDSYEDDAPDRDCIVYRIATQWEEPPQRLACGAVAPFSLADLTPEFVQANLPTAVNKLTLSNFVDSNYLRDLREVIELFPTELRHAYTASSLSEAVDKLIKVLHLVRGPRRRLLTIAGHWFGDGTLVSRALSCDPNALPSPPLRERGQGEGADGYWDKRLDPNALPSLPRRGRGQSEGGEADNNVGGRPGELDWFDVVHLPPIPATEQANWFAVLQRHLRTDQCLGMFIEPMPVSTLIRIGQPVLERLAAACRAAGVPLVFQETASLFYRYGREGFAASGAAGVPPDGIVADLGGQMALSLVQQPYFDAAPLKLISTWDGDSFSLAKFAAVARSVERDRREYFRRVDEFQQTLIAQARTVGATRWDLQQGVGWIEGLSPGPLADSLRCVPPYRHLVCPAPGELRRFLW